jgi:acetylornithine deacetylase/succinyl-diaminopimelate desuccinylase-like protein
MAHQDVVPVDPKTVDEWTHPPYSGFYDGERIWGRGSSDDKSGLMGILIAIETLIEQGYSPKRGIVLSFGFDEETSGLFGAQENAKALKTIYGEKAFAMIVDEGGGFSEQYGGVLSVISPVPMMETNDDVPQCSAGYCREGVSRRACGRQRTRWSLFNPTTAHQHWHA